MGCEMGATHDVALFRTSCAPRSIDVGQTNARVSLSVETAHLLYQSAD